jgi:serine/threonine protein phosphatase PrpC
VKDGYGYRSEQRLRKENQDTFGVFELSVGKLIVVCDGMGGHVGGAQASALAVRTLHDVLFEGIEGDPRAGLKRAIETANRVIYETARKNYRLSGMGTTLVAALIQGNTVHIAHVGDSRAFLIRGGEARQLTRDHTMVNMFVDAELLAPEDAATHPEAHVLSRSLGVARNVEVEQQAAFDLHAGDRLILTSDGVHGVVGTSALAQFDWSSPQRGADEAMRTIENAQGDDNATLVVVAREYVGAASPATRPPDIAQITEQANASETMVRPVGAMNGEGGPEDDVAPIEDLDDLAANFAPKIGPHALTQEGARKAQERSNFRAFLALGGLTFVGSVLAALVFRDRPNPQGPVQLPNVPAAVSADGAVGLVNPGRTDPATGAAQGPTPQLATPNAAAMVGQPPPGPSAVPTVPLTPVGPAPTPAAWAAISTIIVPGADWSDHLWTGDGLAMVGDLDAFRRAGGSGEPAQLAWASGLLYGDDPSAGAWAPPPRCLDCTRSISRPSSLAYLRPEASELLAGVFFKPSTPQAPQRNPVQPQRYSENAPRGPAQATAIRQARNKECPAAMHTVDAAMERSVDHAVLYRTAWICFNENDQYPLTQANVATFREFQSLETHFRGAAVRAQPSALVSMGAAALGSTSPGTSSYVWTWADPAAGGIEYRLERFMADRELRGFQDVMFDMLGEASIADQLGVDLLLECTAAAAASRNDAPDNALIDMWARRVYYATAAMNGAVGELIRTHRPDLTEVITNLLFEATGGDAGAQALAAGLPNTFVPEQVALAQARALGIQVRIPATPVLASAEPVASAPRPVVRRPSTPAPVRRPAAAPPPPPPSAAPPPRPSSEPLSIKVFKARKSGQ